MLVLAIISVAAVLIVAGIFLRRGKALPFLKKRTPAGESQGFRPLEAAETDLILNSVPNFLCLKDQYGRWLQVSPVYKRIYRLNGNDCVGHTDLELCQNPTSDQEGLLMSAIRDQEAWDLGHPLNDVQTLYSSGKEGETSYELTRTPLFDRHKERFRLLVTGNPIESSKRVGLDVFASVFYLSKLPFLLLDSEMKIYDINNAFTSFTGYSKRNAVGNHFVFLGADVNPWEYSSIISAFLRENQQQSWVGETSCHCKNGRVVPVRLVVSRVVANADENPETHYFALMSDISKQKEAERKLRHIAHYDDMTGLPNRTLFLEKLKRALGVASRHKLHPSVVFINLDRFKSVNESLGHEAGNLLLKAVAGRLSEAMEKEDFLARFSGDEFVVMHGKEKDHETATVVSSMVAQRVISALVKHFFINNQEIYVSVSIGIAVFPEDAQNAEALIKNADIAMHEAKKIGSNNFKFFQQEYTSKAKERHQLESSLRRALQRNELLLHYQPQYSADGEELCGAEVLIRWLQGGTKMISPYFFIDIAEETGLIIPIGKWILETACRQLKSWMDAGYGLQRVSVNVSARQFMSPNFVETVEAALQVSGLDPKCLELEITESMLIGDAKRIELQLTRFKKMGISIALDDFGTGYSSLAYLKNFPIDVVKIDQSFVRGMAPGSTDARIVCAIIEMGHSLGYHVVAEGVEDETQFLYLREKGCDIIQGYFFSKPLPVLDMGQLLKGAAA